MTRYILGILVALVAASCSSSSSGGRGDGEDGEAPASLTEFVTELIEHKTVDELRPMGEGDFVSLPDPDADTNNLAAYWHLF